MPECKQCGNKFQNRVVIKGKVRVLNRRKYCLDCSPFGKHNTKQVHLPPKKRKKYDSVHEWQQRTRIERKQWLVEHKGGKCVICGYNRCLHALDFHHVRDKEFELSQSNLTSNSWEKIVVEVDKTVLLCKVCHTEVGAGMHQSEEKKWSTMVSVA